MYMQAGNVRRADVNALLKANALNVVQKSDL